MLYDKEFLLKLDKSKNKTIYARVTALQFNESPIEYIEGRVTGGSINIDGASAVRRTCSLTMVAQDFDYNDYYWGLNTKFKLEIGLENLVDSTYPDIIWFNQGIYLITSFNTSRSTNNFTISINGKDKMCLLNGEVSGSLESSVDFGTIEEESSDGVWTIRKIPIPEIIRNAVHVYAGEPYWNIVINDLDTYGLELLEYRYNVPMYLYRRPNSIVFDNVIIENNSSVFYIDIGTDNEFVPEPKKLKDLDYNHLDLLVDTLTGSPTPQYVYDKVDTVPEGWEYEIYAGDKYIKYIFAKVEYGQTAGYRVTDLTYAGDLIANVGESLTSVLDKIKNMLVEFEYFYDLDGRFVFQKKRSFVNTLWTPMSIDEQGNYVVMESLMTASATAYTFSGGELITAFNNNPNLLNMRNDYSIWGQRTGVSGAAIPVHMRYAIDNKPKKYVQITVDDLESKLVIDNYNLKYGTALTGRSSNEVTTYALEGTQVEGERVVYTEWREIIYQMALDYYKYNILDDFELRLIKANPEYPTGQTGYEPYYIDMQGFWRQLYNPDLRDEIDKTKALISDIKSEEPKISLSYWTEEVTKLESEISVLNQKFLDGSITEEEYYVLMGEKKRALLDARDKLGMLETKLEDLISELESLEKDKENYYQEEGDRQYWNRDVFESPETINFWFDFLDTPGELQQFNVKTVGSRSKAINDSTVKSIYFRETPSVIFTNDISGEDWLTGYKYIQVPEANMESMFTISAQGKSAKNRLDELIYQHGYCIESATITAIPVYYLEPNTRIYLHDEETNLDGDYIISKITLPLSYNGTMSITATKAAESLF